MNVRSRPGSRLGTACGRLWEAVRTALRQVCGPGSRPGTGPDLRSRSAAAGAWGVGAWVAGRGVAGVLRRCGVLLLSGLLAGGCSKGGPGTGGPPAKRERSFPVRVETAREQFLRYEMETTGTVEAQEVYRIDAQVSGTVYDVSFREGDLVKKDTLLCRIAPNGYRLAALRAEGEYRRAVAEVADAERRLRNSTLNAEIALRTAEIEVRRRTSVKAAGAISDEEVELYKARRDQAEVELKDMREAALTQVEVLRAAALEREAVWKIALEDVRKSTMLPPVEGQIEQRLVTNGNFVTAGTPLAMLIDLSSLRLNFTLPEEQAPHLRKDAQVVFRVQAYPNREFTAQVYYVGALADRRTRLVGCWARVTPSDFPLKAGLFASVKIVTAEKKQAVVIPQTAVLPTEYGFVAFVIEDGKAVRRKIETGLHLADRALEVLSGLRAGEVVVVEGASSLQDGVSVKVLAAAGGAARAGFAPGAGGGKEGTLPGAAGPGGGQAPGVGGAGGAGAAVGGAGQAPSVPADGVPPGTSHSEKPGPEKARQGSGPP